MANVLFFGQDTDLPVFFAQNGAHVTMSEGERIEEFLAAPPLLIRLLLLPYDAIVVAGDGPQALDLVRKIRQVLRTPILCIVDDSEGEDVMPILGVGADQVVDGRRKKEAVAQLARLLERAT